MFKIVYKFIYYFLRIVLFPFYRLHYVGRENLPEGACVLCANHTANIDAVFLALASGPHTNYGILAKEELFRFRPFGAFLRCCGAVPVRRESSDFSAVKAGFSVLKAGKRLLIFPEGTRVKPGRPYQLKTGAALFSIRGKAPLVPVYIPAGRKAFRKNTVVIGKPYLPQVEGKPDQEQYLQITRELMERIRRLGEGKALP